MHACTFTPPSPPSLINHAGFSGGKASSKFNGNCMHQYGRHLRHAPAAWPDPEQRGTVCALCQSVHSVTRTSRFLPSPTCTSQMSLEQQQLSPFASPWQHRLVHADMYSKQKSTFYLLRFSLKKKRKRKYIHVTPQVKNMSI